MFARLRPGARGRGGEPRRSRVGSQYLLPTEDSIWVAGELARRYGLPLWQFTLAATSANTEVIRIGPRPRPAARRCCSSTASTTATSTTSWSSSTERPAGAGGGRACRATSPPTTSVVPFNDLDALRAALEPRDVAVVITEPALTNNVGLLMPDDGFHDGLRAMTRDTGTLLAYDETHTQVVGPGGLTRRWGLASDFVTVGKSIAGGIPLGAYGMTEEVAAVLSAPAAATTRSRRSRSAARCSATRSPWPRRARR